MASRHFLTVEWCKNGKRGIFSDRDGNAFSDESELSRERMEDILDVFFLILNPKSMEFTEEEITQYTQFYPLAEYSNQYGIVLKKSPSLSTEAKDNANPK